MSLGVPGAPRGLAPRPLLTAIAFLVEMDLRMMTPLQPTIAHSLGTSVTGIGRAMALYMLPYGRFWHRLFLAFCGVSLVALGVLAVRLLGAAPGLD